MDGGTGGPVAKKPTPWESRDDGVQDASVSEEVEEQRSPACKHMEEFDNVSQASETTVLNDLQPFSADSGGEWSPACSYLLLN